jgi:4-hydroxybenzoate polyprenyltransferase
LWSVGFWRAYLVTMRPYLLFVSGVAGMAGFADGPARSSLPTLGAFAAFFLSYGFGQALTDCFQMDTDSLSSPYRPLVQGAVRRRDVLLVSLVGLAGCCAVLALLNVRTAILGAAAIVGLATYTFFKRRWWAGPFYNAWIVALLPVMGKLAASGQQGSLGMAVGSGMLPWIALSVLLSYANFVLMGYFKDISADRASGYHTFCVVFGWEKTAIASDALAAASVVATGLALLVGAKLTDGTFPELSLVAFAGAALALLLAQIGIHRTREEAKAHKPIANVVRGFLLLHLAEICLVRPGWGLVAVLFYAGFEVTLWRRPKQTQV